MARAKVKYLLEITAEMEKDGAYFGTTETLDWFIDHAVDDARNMTVLIQQGATEPVRLRNAQVRVKRIVLDDPMKER